MFYSWYITPSIISKINKLDNTKSGNNIIEEHFIMRGHYVI